MLEAAQIIPDAACQELTNVLTVTDNEWMERWRILSSVRLSGPTRSFLWKLMHRTLPLLSLPWLAARYNRPSHCLLCPHRVPESYSHLFSTCQFATALWEAVEPVLTSLRIPPQHEFDPRPARLIGDLSQLDTTWISGLPWGEDVSPPKAERQIHYFRTMWTEVRGTVLKAIWDVRCKLMFGRLASRDEAHIRAHQQVQAGLCAIIFYTKVPTALTTGLQRIPTGRAQTFYDSTWGQLVPALVPQQHQIAPPTSPPPPGGGGGVGGEQANI